MLPDVHSSRSSDGLFEARPVSRPGTSRARVRSPEHKVSRLSSAKLRSVSPPRPWTPGFSNSRPSSRQSARSAYSAMPIMYDTHSLPEVGIVGNGVNVRPTTPSGTRHDHWHHRDESPMRARPDTPEMGMDIGEYIAMQEEGEDAFPYSPETLPAEVDARSVGVQVAPTPWTRFYFDKADELAQGKARNPFFAHFDVKYPEPVEEQAKKYRMVDDMPGWIGDAYQKLYYKEHSGQEQLGGHGWADVNMAGGSRSMDLTAGNHPIVGESDENQRVAMDVSMFCEYVTRLEPRSHRDTRPLLLLLRGIVTYLIDQLAVAFEVAKQEAAEREAAEKEMMQRDIDRLTAELEAAMKREVAAEEHATRAIEEAKAELELKYGSRLAELEAQVDTLTQSLKDQARESAEAMASAVGACRATYDKKVDKMRTDTVAMRMRKMHLVRKLEKDLKLAQADAEAAGSGGAGDPRVARRLEAEVKKWREEAEALRASNDILRNANEMLRDRCKAAGIDISDISKDGTVTPPAAGAPEAGGAEGGGGAGGGGGAPGGQSKKKSHAEVSAAAAKGGNAAVATYTDLMQELGQLQLRNCDLKERVALGATSAGAREALCESILRAGPGADKAASELLHAVASLASEAGRASPQSRPSDVQRRETINRLLVGDAAARAEVLSLMAEADDLRAEVALPRAQKAAAKMSPSPAARARAEATVKAGGAQAVAEVDGVYTQVVRLRADNVKLEAQCGVGEGARALPPGCDAPLSEEEVEDMMARILAGGPEGREELARLIRELNRLRGDKIQLLGTVEDLNRRLKELRSDLGLDERGGAPGGYVKMTEQERSAMIDRIMAGGPEARAELERLITDLDDLRMQNDLLQRAIRGATGQAEGPGYTPMTQKQRKDLVDKILGGGPEAEAELNKLLDELEMLRMHVGSGGAALQAVAEAANAHPTPHVPSPEEEAAAIARAAQGGEAAQEELRKSQDELRDLLAELDAMRRENQALRAGAAKAAAAARGEGPGPMSAEEKEALRSKILAGGPEGEAALDELLAELEALRIVAAGHAGSYQGALSAADKDALVSKILAGGPEAEAELRKLLAEVDMFRTQAASGKLGGGGGGPCGVCGAPAGAEGAGGEGGRPSGVSAEERAELMSKILAGGPEGEAALAALIDELSQLRAANARLLAAAGPEGAAAALAKAEAAAAAGFVAMSAEDKAALVNKILAGGPEGEAALQELLAELEALRMAAAIAAGGPVPQRTEEEKAALRARILAGGPDGEAALNELFQELEMLRAAVGPAAVAAAMAAASGGEGGAAVQVAELLAEVDQLRKQNEALGAGAAAAEATMAAAAAVAAAEGGGAKPMSHEEREALISQILAGGPEGEAALRALLAELELLRVKVAALQGHTPPQMSPAETDAAVARILAGGPEAEAELRALLAELDAFRARAAAGGLALGGGEGAGGAGANDHEDGSDPHADGEKCGSCGALRGSCCNTWECPRCGGPVGACCAFAKEPIGGVLSLKAPAMDVLESAGQAVIVVDRLIASAGLVTVMVTTSDLSARAGQDYEPLAAHVLTWQEGDTAPKEVAVAIMQDDFNEGDEEFEVSISMPSGGAVLGGVTKTTVKIVDDSPVPAEGAAKEEEEEAADLFAMDIKPWEHTTGKQTLEVPGEWEKFLGGKDWKKSRTIPPRKMRSIVCALYQSKIGADQVDDDEGNIREELAVYTTEYFTNFFGVKKLAQQKLGEFIVSCKQYFRDGKDTLLCQCACLMGLYNAQPSKNHAILLKALELAADVCSDTRRKPAVFWSKVSSGAPVKLNIEECAECIFKIYDVGTPEMEAAAALVDPLRKVFADEGADEGSGSITLDRFLTFMVQVGANLNHQAEPRVKKALKDAAGKNNALDLETFSQVIDQLVDGVNPKVKSHIFAKAANWTSEAAQGQDTGGLASVSACKQAVVMWVDLEGRTTIR